MKVRSAEAVCQLDDCFSAHLLPQGVKMKLTQAADMCGVRGRHRSGASGGLKNQKTAARVVFYCSGVTEAMLKCVCVWEKQGSIYCVILSILMSIYNPEATVYE